MLTHALVKKLLSYDPCDGSFHTRPPAKIRRRDHIIKPNWYRSVRVINRNYYAHRLAWFYTYGEWPDFQIDHINSDKGDNRLANLRQADASENNMNKGKRADNTTGFKGVQKDKKGRGYSVSIRAYGERFYLGYFDDPREGYAAYCRAAEILHKQFAKNE